MRLGNDRISLRRDEIPSLRTLAIEFAYALLTTIHARASYQLCGPLECYAGFDWSNENYQLAERPEDRDRFYYYEKRLSAGLQWKVYEQIALDLSSGYCFDRYYFQGHGFELTGPDRVDVGMDHLWPFA